MFPELKRHPGVHTWKVGHINKKERMAGTNLPFVWFDTVEALGPKAPIPLSLFPPTPEEVEKFHLERCMRLYPHLQDTGGFFVALLKKVAEIPRVPRTANTICVSLLLVLSFAF